MVRFWDTSAIVPLLLDEPMTSLIVREFSRDGSMIVWWATEVECRSALARRSRMTVTSPAAESTVVARLDTLTGSWEEVLPSEEVRALARRVIRVHELRAADAFQLAAALVGSERSSRALEFVSLDAHLTDAARREGFRIADFA